MPDTDPLAAELAAIRRRAEDITSSHGDPGEEDSCDLNGETCTGHDAERLLAAVEAVLKGHTSEPVFLGADDCECPAPRSDDDHPPGAADVGPICLLSEVGRYCPACTEMVYEDEGPVGDEYVNASNCIVRPAVSAALLGEEPGRGRD